MISMLVFNKNYSTGFEASLLGRSRNGWRSASTPPLIRTIFRTSFSSPPSN